MKNMLARTAIGGVALVLLAGSASSQTSNSSTTVQMVTFESNLSSLNSGTSSMERRGSGTGATTLRLERDASGKLIKATVFVRFESRTNQPETFTQFQILGPGFAALTVPLNAAQTTPEQTFVTTSQTEITDAETLARIEQLLQNPSRFSLSLGEAATSSPFLSGPFSETETTLLSRAETRLQAVGSLERSMYRLLIRMAAASGTISQAERDAMMTELNAFSQQLDQANRIGSGINSTINTNSGVAVSAGTSNP